MDKSQLMDSFDGQDTLRHVESCYVLGESVVFDEHSHQITPREKLHDEIQIQWILKRVEQLHNPCRI